MTDYFSTPAAPNWDTMDAATADAAAQAWADWWADNANTEAAALVAAAAAFQPTATSTSSNSIGTGTKTFSDIGTGKPFIPGQWVVMSDTAAPTTNYMFGQIVTYAGGVLTVTSLRVGGSGTKTAWAIGLSGPQGEGGDVLPAFAGNAGKKFYVNAGETAGEWLADWTQLGAISAASLNGQTSVSFTSIDSTTYPRLMLVGSVTPSTTATINITIGDGTDTLFVAGGGSINAAAGVGLMVQRADSTYPFCIGSVYTTAGAGGSGARVPLAVSPITSIAVSTTAGTFNNAGGLTLYGGK